MWTIIGLFFKSTVGPGLAAFWRAHAQTILEVALAAVAGALIWWAAASHAHQADRPKIDAAKKEASDAKRDAAQARADLALEKFYRTAADEASKGYQDELQKLHAAAAARAAPSVRCHVSAAGLGGPASLGGSDGAAAAAGILSPRAGPDTRADTDTGDIGQWLYEKADRCDALSAQVRGLQDFTGRIAVEPR